MNEADPHQAQGVAPTDSVLDLTAEPWFTYWLLDGTWAWRERVVEEVHLSDRDHARVSTAYQIRLDREAATGFGAEPRHDHVRAIVPLGMRDKRPLFGFGIRGHQGATSSLLLRSRGALLQAEYVETIAREGPASPAIEEFVDRDLLRAICEFTPGIYLPFRHRHRRVRKGLTDYLEEGLGWSIPSSAISKLIQLQGESGAILNAQLTEPTDPSSSSENVLLAIPLMASPPETADELQSVVEQYRSFVHQLRDDGDEYTLRVLAEYGRRWDVFVETQLPIGIPAKVVIDETRPLSLRPVGRATLAVDLRDAPSTHLELRVADPHVTMAAWPIPRVREHRLRRRVELPIMQGVRYTRESFAVYSSDPERPQRVDVTVNLRPNLSTRVVSWLVIALTVAAIGFSHLAPEGQQLVPTLTLLTVPTTFAIALLLGREHSALAVRLQAMARLATGLLAVAMWTVALHRLWAHLELP